MTEEDQRPRTRETFDATGADFVALGRHLWEPIGLATAHATASTPGENVLDACCGTGASALPAAAMVGEEGGVDAIDVSETMIEVLRQLSVDMPQLRTHTQDVLTWDRGGYDAVQCALGIFFFPDMRTGVERLIGLAKPKGHVTLTIWRGDAMATAGRHLSRAVAHVTDTEAPERKPHLIDHINQPAPFANWLTSCGLTDVRVETSELSLDLTPDLAWLVVLGSGFRGALTDLGPDRVAEVRTRYLESLAADDINQLDATTLIGAGRRTGL